MTPANDSFQPLLLLNERSTLGLHVRLVPVFITRLHCRWFVHHSGCPWGFQRRLVSSLWPGELGRKSLLENERETVDANNDRVHGVRNYAGNVSTESLPM